MTLRKQLKQLLIEKLNLEDIIPEAIGDDMPLFGEGLGLDSLEALQLVVSVEENFGVLIPDEEVGKVAFASVNALARFIIQEKGKE